mgnify:CR=1 FL=1
MAPGGLNPTFHASASVAGRNIKPPSPPQAQTIHWNTSWPSPTTRGACWDFSSACVVVVRLRNATENAPESQPQIAMQFIKQPQIAMQFVNLSIATRSTSQESCARPRTYRSLAHKAGCLGVLTALSIEWARREEREQARGEEG